MINGCELAKQLEGLKPSWELLARLEASAPDAAKYMRCSRRTALKSLKEATARIEHQTKLDDIAIGVAECETRYATALASSWPVVFKQMAERLGREGSNSENAGDRRLAVEKLPRSIQVAR